MKIMQFIPILVKRNELITRCREHKRFIVFFMFINADTHPINDDVTNKTYFISPFKGFELPFKVFMFLFVT